MGFFEGGGTFSFGFNNISNVCSPQFAVRGQFGREKTGDHLNSTAEDPRWTRTHDLLDEMTTPTTAAAIY